jgi:hypothetical protein
MPGSGLVRIPDPQIDNIYALLPGGCNPFFDAGKQIRGQFLHGLIWHHG